ncbi:hypothetical protein EVAR_44852_1 [Eumeta japonica]|uniref:Uncharacterized protein n=1 Tax=Eumeta variegata TaxID=151549 RepID=A0A4C1YLU8_EUMVA|nr:hypothetical protein EVAR_44852_1 [Eumeta japonica]
MQCRCDRCVACVECLGKTDVETSAVHRPNTYTDGETNRRSIANFRRWKFAAAINIPLGVRATECIASRVESFRLCREGARMMIRNATTVTPHNRQSHNRSRSPEAGAAGGVVARQCQHLRNFEIIGSQGIIRALEVKTSKDNVVQSQGNIMSEILYGTIIAGSDSHSTASTLLLKAVMNLKYVISRTFSSSAKTIYALHGAERLLWHNGARGVLNEPFLSLISYAQIRTVHKACRINYVYAPHAQPVQKRLDKNNSVPTLATVVSAARAARGRRGDDKMYYRRRRDLLFARYALTVMASLYSSLKYLLTRVQVFRSPTASTKRDEVQSDEPSRARPLRRCTWWAECGRRVGRACGSMRPRGNVNSSSSHSIRCGLQRDRMSDAGGSILIVDRPEPAERTDVARGKDYEAAIQHDAICTSGSAS